MTAVLARLSGSRWPTVAWRLAAWTVITIATGLAAHPRWAEWTAGSLLAGSAIALQFVAERFSDPTRMSAVLVTTVLGLGAVIVSPSGLGEITVYVAASRLPYPLSLPFARAFVVLDTLAVAAVVGYASHSLVGALAGLGVPLLAQRSEERRALIAERDRAQALLVEVQGGRDAAAQAATLQERGRIARDLHDTLAHSLAGLSVQLQAIRAVAARAGSGPEIVDPLDRAAALAREGLVEARAAVSALRDPVGLGLAELPALVGRHPGSPSLQTSGQPHELSPEAGHAVYRVVQEALTNAARHAPGAAVAVCVTWSTDALTVRIENTEGRDAVPGTSRGTGLGLAGMSERVAAVAGTVTAGPRDGGGWLVEARVPLSEEPT